jgi:hypothetical protein
MADLYLMLFLRNFKQAMRAQLFSQLQLILHNLLKFRRYALQLPGNCSLPGKRLLFLHLRTSEP